MTRILITALVTIELLKIRNLRLIIVKYFFVMLGVEIASKTLALVKDRIVLEIFPPLLKPVPFFEAACSLVLIVCFCFFSKGFELRMDMDKTVEDGKIKSLIHSFFHITEPHDEQPSVATLPVAAAAEADA